MSVEQRVKISCDNFDCDAVLHSGVGLSNARTIASEAGWVNTVHYIGFTRRTIVQDFCPEHREQGFDHATWAAKEADRKSHDSGSSDVRKPNVTP